MNDMTRRRARTQEVVMPKVGETVAEARSSRHIPSNTTPTSRIASGSYAKILRRSGRILAKEMDATYAKDHTAMPGAPR